MRERFDISSKIEANAHRYCSLCNSEGSLLYVDLRDRLLMTHERWSFRKCNDVSCGLIWLDPMPTQNAIKDIYNSYYEHIERITNGIHGEFELKFRRNIKLFHSILNRITPSHEAAKLHDLRYLRHVQSGRLLDVGCGNGQWLAKMRTLGWQVEGQDIDEKAVAICREAHGLTTHLGNLKEIGLAEDEFDAVTMNHVIEHLPDPVDALRECYRIIKPNGRLIVITPNAESHGHRCFGSNWLHLDPPRHFHIFSQHSLRLASEEAGFINPLVFTVAGSPRTMAKASLDIRWTGSHNVGQIGFASRVRSNLAAIFFHLSATRIYSTQPDAGEECVLIARK